MSTKELPTFQEVQDLAQLPSLNPDLAERKTAKIRLSNQLEILLVSDPGADQSAAAMAVEVGSWSDPSEYAGMAHFCEHMLFMGTQKYPNENEFFSLVSNYAGLANAFTAPNRTVYMFSAQPDGFLDILDRFAHFFIDPLFKPENIAREMHAVDQEFAKNVENDGWREYMIFKETGNPNHPNQGFSVGNSQTLAKIPQSALKKWHQQHYGANRMHLAIYSSLPLDTLKQTVTEIFSAVPQTDHARTDHQMPITSELQKGHIVYIKPIKNKQILGLSWELPAELCAEESKSAEILAYALERGQKYSLYEKLKEEQLIDAMTVSVDDFGGKEHSFFQISLQLTQKGVEQIDTAILRCFQAIAGLKTTGLPAYLFQEKNKVAQLLYQYEGRESAFDYIKDLGDSLVDEELATFPRNTLLAQSYSPQKIAEAAAFLKPDTCLISLLAPPEITKVFPEKKEKWSGAEYAIRPISSQWINAWKQAAPHPQIRLAEPNPYLPAHLRPVSEQMNVKTPISIANTALGSAFYVRCPEFSTPTSVYHLHISSPELTPSAQSAVLASLYLDHLTDLLHPTLAAASKAGLECQIEMERARIHLGIAGFSEKAPLLLQEIVKQMPLTPPTREQFDLYVARHEKDYANSQKDLAAKQAKELLDSIVNQDKTTKREKLAALKTIRYEDLLDFQKNLFKKTYLEGLFAGNLSLKEAESIWLDVTHVLGRTPYPKAERSRTQILQLPEGTGPFKLAQTTQVQGNAAILLLDQGLFTFPKRSAQEILSGVLRESFFDELRTKQKTGYIVQSDATELEENLFQYFLVQSNSHHPEELLYRFELFIEEFAHVLPEKISSERFETLKQSQVSSLKNRFCNLKDKAGLWDRLAFQYDADFQFIDKRIAALEELNYEDFLAFSQGFLSRENRKRLAVLFEGKLAAPFSYEPVELGRLGEVASYAPRPERALERSSHTQ
jgi:insulysin